MWLLSKIKIQSKRLWIFFPMFQKSQPLLSRVPLSRCAKYSTLNWIINTPIVALFVFNPLKHTPHTSHRVGGGREGERGYEREREREKRREWKENPHNIHIPFQSWVLIFSRRKMFVYQKSIIHDSWLKQGFSFILNCQAIKRYLKYFN